MKIADEKNIYKELKNELKEKAHFLGADFFGVADLEEVKKYIRVMHGNFYAKFPRGISMGVSFPAEVVGQLRRGPQMSYLYYYELLNDKLNSIALCMAGLLFKRGHRAFPVSASWQRPDREFQGIFSHRLAASRAGLGWIGKSCSLINPIAGPRLRIVTVLTDAPLPADQSLTAGCGDCRACIQACPPGALKGTPFILDDPLSRRFEPRLCNDYISQVRGWFGKGICGKCLAVCHVGRKKQEKIT